MHITAAVYVNDAESGLIQDFDDWLERLAPHEPTDQYRHNNGEDNADAHLKRHLMSHQVVLPITDGRLDLARGSRSSTRSSTADAASASSSRQSASSR